jgi:hypothetical protein
MVSKSETPPPTTADDDGWEDVPTEAKIELDKNGDVFQGIFTGWSETDTGIPQAHFDNAEYGECFMNLGWDLKRQLREVKKGTLVRITRTGTRDTGQKTPMVLYRVQTKRA